MSNSVFSILNKRKFMDTNINTQNTVQMETENTGIESEHFYDKVFRSISNFQKNILYIFHDNETKQIISLQDYLNYLIENNKMEKFNNLIDLVLQKKPLDLLVTTCIKLFSEGYYQYIFYIFGFYSEDMVNKEFRLEFLSKFLWELSSDTYIDDQLILQKKELNMVSKTLKAKYIKRHSTSIEKFIFANFLFSEKVFLNDFLDLYPQFIIKARKKVLLHQKRRFAEKLYQKIKMDLNEKMIYLSNHEIPKDICIDIIDYYM